MSTCRLEECEGNKGRTLPVNISRHFFQEGAKRGRLGSRVLNILRKRRLLRANHLCFPSHPVIYAVLCVNFRYESVIFPAPYGHESYLLVYPVDRFCVSFTLVTLYHFAFGRALDPHALLWHVFPPALEL